MTKRRVVAGGVAAAAAALAVLGPLPASGAPKRQHGVEADVEVLLGSPRKNDGPGEYRISSNKLKAAPPGSPSALTARPTTFAFENQGQVPHNFTVVAATPGAPKFRTTAVPPGATQVLVITLKPGAYLAICTMARGSHFAQGMVKAFTVGTYDPKTGKWS